MVLTLMPDQRVAAWRHEHGAGWLRSSSRLAAGKWPRILALMGCLLLPLGTAAQAQAEGRSLNCSQVQAEAERLVCSDAALAALDRELDAVYRAALAKARGPLVRQLRQEQRGWIKGRNECWKARGQPTWITATWTVNTVWRHVGAQYRLRITELQASGG